MQIEQKLQPFGFGGEGLGAIGEIDGFVQLIVGFLQGYGHG